MRILNIIVNDPFSLSEKMFLIISDQKVPWQIIEKSPVISRHTGHELQRLIVRLYISSPEVQEELENGILRSEEKEITSLDPNSGRNQIWQISNSSYSYSNGDAVIQYTLELTEKESYQIEKLLIQDIEFQPYSFSEYFDEDQLIIEAKVKISKGDEKKLEQLLKEDGYFRVIRVGINNSPIEMRFGRVFWSQDDESKKYSLILVQRRSDGKEEPTPFYVYDIITDNTKNRLIKTDQILNKLIKKLVDKNILTEKEVEEIVKIDDDAAWESALQFIRCNDIDELA